LTTETTEKITKVGYFGEPGSHTENAAKSGFSFYKNMGDFKGEFLPFPTIEDLLESLMQNKIDKAVVPIENSIEGLVTFSADALLIGNGIVIEREVVWRICHCVIGVGDIKKIETIISIPQALSQCKKGIKKLNISIKKESSESTSAAVRLVAEKNDPRIAAIGSRQAWEIYKEINHGLKILVENIQDMEKNQTRFFIMGHKNKTRTGKDKTSIIFGTKNESGSLIDALLIFKALGINMTHISSRPLKTELGEYLFFVEIEGSIEDENIRVALKRVEKITVFFKNLGSYPRAE